jgi:hypothetical protein
MSKVAGKKRASPGAEESTAPSKVNLTDEQLKSLEESQKEFDLVQLSSSE